MENKWKIEVFLFFRMIGCLWCGGVRCLEWKEWHAVGTSYFICGACYLGLFAFRNEEGIRREVLLYTTVWGYRREFRYRVRRG